MGRTIKLNRRHQGATFVVRVLGRERDSWQGEVTWTETNLKQCLRSALELLHLMEGAMCAGEAAMLEAEEADL